MPSAPHALPERTWWIERDHLLGGAYPGDLDPRKARRKLDALLELGIRCFVNLMEEHEHDHAGAPFEPYAPLVATLAHARELHIELARFPIPDQGVPSVAHMRALQAFLDERRALGHRTYVHCWGGRGRTGTVAGITLIRRGLATPQNFTAVIERLRVSDVVRGPAPENETQLEFVRRYPVSD
jgi:hypothetical protein